MVKTPRMKNIEYERGEAIEKLIPALFAELGTLDAVAKDLQISRIALAKWLDQMGATRRRIHRTAVSFPDLPREAEQAAR